MLDDIDINLPWTSFTEK